jgi:hypothetical protein
MNETQTMHLAMINSYNLLTNKATMDDIIESDIIVFGHNPDVPIDEEYFQLIIEYFRDHEMYEICAELTVAYKNMFKGDYKSRHECECDHPVIKGYSKNMRCISCDGKIKRR